MGYEIEQRVLKNKKTIWGIQIKTTLRLYLILVRVAVTKKTNSSEDVWKGEALSTVAGVWTDAAIMKSVWGFLKTWMRILFIP